MEFEDTQVADFLSPFPILSSESRACPDRLTLQGSVLVVAVDLFLLVAGVWRSPNRMIRFLCALNQKHLGQSGMLLSGG